MMKTNWIWIPRWNTEDKEEPRIVYFRKVLKVQKAPKELKVQVSADSRYKLYVNQELVELGPSKGDNQIWYYDTVDLAPYLREGNNVLAAIVLRYPMDHAKGNHGIFRTQMPGFYLFGEYDDGCGNQVDLSTDESWKCYKETKIRIVQEPMGFAPLYFLEEAQGNPEIYGWMGEDYSDSNWEAAKAHKMSVGWKAVSPGNLHPRTIPYMNKIPRAFDEVFVIRQSDSEAKDWNRMLLGSGPITVKANTKEIVEINAGELTTGFLKLIVSGGTGTVIKILQSEGYVQPEEPDAAPYTLPQKADRLDYVNGHLHGFTDIYQVSGLGQNGKKEVYEPFWFRTFRFIQLEIQTANESLTIESFDYMETGYPLEVKSWVRTSDESLKGIWEISERSLRRCMHETYEDCPFYEQLQYAMDTRSQILYTYSVSADDRLARKCFDDFKRSQRYDGMINCSYPSFGPNVIPGFSIYYIMMLHDHMMYFGDKELIRSYLPTIDGILEFFHQNLSAEGIVGKVGGLIFKDAYWSFIDWTKQWNETSGVPRATLSGSITMESLLYILGLEYAAQMAYFIGKDSVAKEYEERADKVRSAIKTYCTGSNGMLQDGPGIEEYSQHCQVFAILTDSIDMEKGKDNLLQTLQHTEVYAQCSVAMALYLFRALEKVGLYGYTNILWNQWREMLKNNLTTCVEDPVGQRSDCHAWGALALYELPAVTLGVRPTKPGFEDMEVKPVAGYLDWAEGEVITPKGMVKVSWKKDGDGIDLNYKLLI
jgi:hypothetical protein